LVAGWPRRRRKLPLLNRRPLLRSQLLNRATEAGAVEMAGRRPLLRNRLLNRVTAVEVVVE
jgi:hypothetical protein